MFNQKGKEIIMKATMKALFIAVSLLLVSFALVSYKTEPTSSHEGELNGKFSISPTEKVVFSKGNLQYCPATKQWRFADHQWEYIGKANELKSEAEFDNYRGWIDMFGFCTSGWYDGHYNINYKPSFTKKEYKEEGYAYEGYGPHKNTPRRDDPRYDWGMYNRIINGGNETNSWRCLNEQELYYLQWQRPCNPTTGYYKNKMAQYKQWNEKSSEPNKIKPSECYMGLATITIGEKVIYGLVFLPDDWNGTPSMGYKFKPYADAVLEFIMRPCMSYSDNVYSYTEWLEMERYGAVLLPAAGKVWPSTLIYDNWKNKNIQYNVMMDFSWYNRKSSEKNLPERFRVPILAISYDGLMGTQNFTNYGNTNKAVRLIRDVR